MLKVELLTSYSKAPTVAHPGEDLGYDIYSREDAVIHPGQVEIIPTGIAAWFDGGEATYGLLVRDRSSLAKIGLSVSGGVIDAGYRGEILVLMTLERDPMSDYVDGYKIDAGDKIAQLVPIQVVTHNGVLIVPSLPDAKRGLAGFGSTGK